LSLPSKYVEIRGGERKGGREEVVGGGGREGRSRLRVMKRKEGPRGMKSIEGEKKGRRG
jgi:hypothetical protein